MHQFELIETLLLTVLDAAIAGGPDYVNQVTSDQDGKKGKSIGLDVRFLLSTVGVIHKLRHHDGGEVEA